MPPFSENKNPDEIEDIFSPLDQGSQPAPLPNAPRQRAPLPRPTPAAPLPTALGNYQPAVRRSFWRRPASRVIIVLLVLIMLLILAGLVYSYFFNPLPANTNADANIVVNNNAAANNADANADANINSNANSQPPVNLTDSDHDGLADDLEINQYQTDPQKIDTDEDGLTDREEVKVYLTEPLDSDTDDDGYSDGDEISNLYNPLGPGKLLNLNTSINELNNQ